MNLSIPSLRVELGQPSPYGRMTLWGFLNAYEPASLALMADPITGLLEDDAKARAECLKAGTKPERRLVRLDAGDLEIGLYPLPLLKALYP